MRTQIVALFIVTATLLVLPAASAGPLREACETVADNPWAPQPIDCRPFDAIADPPTIYETCRAVADNPWAPQPINCHLF